jgi:hypothetical protein
MRSEEERRNYDDNVNLKNALNQAHLKIINLQAKLAQMQQRQKALKRRESFHTVAHQHSQDQSCSPPMGDDAMDQASEHRDRDAVPLRRSPTLSTALDADSLEPMIASVLNNYLYQGRIGAMDGVLPAMTSEIANAIVNARNVSPTLAHRSILTASTPNLFESFKSELGSMAAPTTGHKGGVLSMSTSQIAPPSPVATQQQGGSSPGLGSRTIKRTTSSFRISK